MWLFILIILFGAYLQTVIKLSILKRNFRWGTLLLFTLPVFLGYSLATQINLKYFSFLMNDPNTLSSICVLVIIQEALVLIFGSILLRRYYMGKKLYFWHYAVLLPSSLFPVICFTGIVYLFNTYSGMSFQSTALWFMLGMFLITGILAELLAWKRSNQEQQIQWVALSSLVQVFIAMFLPIIFEGNAPSGDLVKLDLSGIAGIAFIFLAIAVFTLLAYLGLWQKLTIIKKRLLCLNNS